MQANIMLMSYLARMSTLFDGNRLATIAIFSIVLFSLQYKLFLNWNTVSIIQEMEKIGLNSESDPKEVLKGCYLLIRLTFELMENDTKLLRKSYLLTLEKIWEEYQNKCKSKGCYCKSNNPEALFHTLEIPMNTTESNKELGIKVIMLLDKVLSHLIEKNHSNWNVVSFYCFYLTMIAARPHIAYLVLKKYTTSTRSNQTKTIQVATVEEMINRALIYSSKPNSFHFLWVGNRSNLLINRLAPNSFYQILRLGYLHKFYKENITEAADIRSKFYWNLNEQDPHFYPIYKLVQRHVILRNRIRKLYNKICELSGKGNRTIQFTHMQYLRIINGDISAAGKMRNNLLSNQHKLKQLVDSNKLMRYVWAQDGSIVCISLGQNTLGDTTYASNNLSQLTGYKPGKFNIKKIIPEPIRSVHDLLIHPNYSSGRFFDRSINDGVYYMDREGDLQNCEILVKPFYTQNDGLQAMGLIRKREFDDWCTYMYLCNEEGNITGVNEDAKFEIGSHKEIADVNPFLIKAIEQFKLVDRLVSKNELNPSNLVKNALDKQKQTSIAIFFRLYKGESMWVKQQCISCTRRGNLEKSLKTLPQDALNLLVPKSKTSKQMSYNSSIPYSDYESMSSGTSSIACNCGGEGFIYSKFMTRIRSYYMKRVKRYMFMLCFSKNSLSINTCEEQHPIFADHPELLSLISLLSEDRNITDLLDDSFEENSECIEELILDERVPQALFRSELDKTKALYQNYKNNKRKTGRILQGEITAHSHLKNENLQKSQTVALKAYENMSFLGKGYQDITSNVIRSSVFQVEGVQKNGIMGIIGNVQIEEANLEFNEEMIVENMSTRRNLLTQRKKSQGKIESHEIESSKSEERSQIDIISDVIEIEIEEVAKRSALSIRTSQSQFGMRAPKSAIQRLLFHNVLSRNSFKILIMLKFNIIFFFGLLLIGVGVFYSFDTHIFNEANKNIEITSFTTKIELASYLISSTTILYGIEVEGLFSDQTKLDWQIDELEYAQLYRINSLSPLLYKYVLADNHDFTKPYAVTLDKSKKPLESIYLDDMVLNKLGYYNTMPYFYALWMNIGRNFALFKKGKKTELLESSNFLLRDLIQFVQTKSYYRRLYARDNIENLVGWLHILWCAVVIVVFLNFIITIIALFLFIMRTIKGKIYLFDKLYSIPVSNRLITATITIRFDKRL